ncbi:MAG TPA: DNA polymerase III subunit gamma/tau [Tenuifilaceae bacterium]|nr:DNA polymerase III subunit gamma/tau [Tenuifilaceae bacterium]
MENFIVSARKYRPSTFKSVVGQTSITTTLKNAIQRKQLAQAYLFCGPRGVGKTTCARIFAKTINCLNLTDENEACNECESCKSFSTNRSFNIHELDAASNNSVEGIRKLIEQVRIPPQIGKYSVYIIDEVHMLSASAFNAFLKTLEEPPAHAIFIMATTEKHKILPTILSRCQIFDFNRIRVEDTVKYLEYIAKTEGIDYEVEALNIIAQKADGAMRDALSIFDQAVSFSENHITYEKVIENLNVLDYQYYFRLTDNFLSGNMTDSLKIFDELLSKGFDAQQFITGLSQHLRNLLVCKDSDTIQLLEVGAAIAEKYTKMASTCPIDFLVNALQLSNQYDVSFRQSPNQRLHVELLLIRLCGLTQEKKKSESPANIEEGDVVEQKPQKQTKPAQKVKHETYEPAAVNEPSTPIIPKTTSLKGALKKNTVESYTASDIDQPEIPSVAVNLPNDSEYKAITQDILGKAWSSFAESIKEEKPGQYSLLQLYGPELLSDGKAYIRFETQIQVDMFREIKTDLLTFLKQSLKVNPPEILEEIAETDEKNKPRLFTADDKLKFLLQHNPALRKMKQKLNLDLE